MLRASGFGPRATPSRARWPRAAGVYGVTTGFGKLRTRDPARGGASAPEEPRPLPRRGRREPLPPRWCARCSSSGSTRSSAALGGSRGDRRRVPDAHAGRESRAFRSRAPSARAATSPPSRTWRSSSSARARVLARGERRGRGRAHAGRGAPPRRARAAPGSRRSPSRRRRGSRSSTGRRRSRPPPPSGRRRARGSSAPRRSRRAVARGDPRERAALRRPQSTGARPHPGNAASPRTSGGCSRGARSSEPRGLRAGAGRVQRPLRAAGPRRRARRARARVARRRARDELRDGQPARSSPRAARCLGRQLPRRAHRAGVRPRSASRSRRSATHLRAARSRAWSNPDLSGPARVPRARARAAARADDRAVTAAALVSENKMLAHPASVDSIPTSANKEDHVSMAPIAALQAARSSGTSSTWWRSSWSPRRWPRVPRAASEGRRARGRARALREVSPRWTTTGALRGHRGGRRARRRRHDAARRSEPRRRAARAAGETAETRLRGRRVV